MCDFSHGKTSMRIILQVHAKFDANPASPNVSLLVIKQG